MTYKELLSEFIKLKSVSTDPKFADEIQKTAQWLKDLFDKHGFQTTLEEGYGNPIVVASYVVNPTYETCLVYGHYDVQPADFSEGWESDPFELTERDNRLYARGAIDNKGQIMVHIFTVLDLIEKGELGYNVKFLLEGNEETGSADIDKFLAARPELLKADFAMISDGEITMGHPVIEVSFRGVLNATVAVQTSEKDLHSGLYGGVAPSAAKELTALLSKMVDQNGTILVSGFYDDVPQPSDEEMAPNKTLPFDPVQYETNTGTPAVVTEPGWDFYNQLAFRPTFQITGISTGYTGTGYRNAIPGKALAKINIRFHGNQDPQRLLKVLQDFAQDSVPEYVKVSVTNAEISSGVFLDVSNKYVEKAETLLAESFGTDVLRMYCGATLPIVADFKNLLNMPQVLAPLANEDCNMHGANENYDMEILNKSLEFSRRFFGK